ncbi:MAG: amidohydrolase family protein [Deltaproteobacteria bacterium]|nr:amidohydrolase family protein [Deltaproteobacteria bacterium]
MAFDLVIKNGSLVDGTGSAARRADVAVQNGVIAEVGQVSGGADRVIDASDLVVAPGFVDHHTHYDAQICWDPTTSCSPWHGVTSVVMGNCGVGLAPCRPESREIAAWDLVNVEAIPFEVLSEGVTWDWETFPEYMDAAARRGSGTNLGFLCALTPFRHYVMGEESMDRAASAEQTTQIAALLREAMNAGALGFSTTTAPQHIGYQGRPLACRQASRDEIEAYCGVLRELGKGTIALNLNARPGEVDEDEQALLDLLVTTSQRPVTWLSLLVRDDQPQLCRETLEQTKTLLDRGARPQVSCRPFIMQIDLKNPFAFGSQPAWKPVFNKSVEEQLRIYRDPSFRDAVRGSMQLPFFNQLEVHHTEHEGQQGLLGKTVSQIAKERGGDPVDTLLDIAIEAELEVEFSMEALNTNEDELEYLVTHDQTLIGLSDGGAHVDQLCDAGYCTYLLGHWVREKQALSLEHAVRRITSEPADFFGLHDRGRIALGKAADFAIFDPDSVGSDRRAEMRHDLPAGGRRMVMQARGMHYTIVNGEVLFEGQKHTGALPGQVLRSA